MKLTESTPYKSAPQFANPLFPRFYRDLYDELLNNEKPEVARQYLNEQLEEASCTAHDLPMHMEDLPVWAHKNVIATGIKYREYLRARKDGAPRRYFSNKSHALFFLKNVAPTKMVDGSWLYGALRHWKSPNFQDLIRIYLEELGDGVASKNHVSLFKCLLTENNCEWHDLDDDLFQQGAIQLAFSHHCEEFLPELIGFNLGYEQLPLHLLVTAYELSELGIDPYYFTLHITIDNLDSGHAKRALHSVEKLRPHDISAKDFYRRVTNGYQLNSIGESTTDIISGFDIQAEMVKLFQHKSSIGQYMHSDRCKIGGRTVNDWLASPDKIPDFLTGLEKSGWIKRHQDPTQSRFWQLLQGDRPPMFGVFTAFEQQLIFDWIAGDNATRPRMFIAEKSDTKRYESTDESVTHSAVVDIDNYRREHYTSFIADDESKKLRQLDQRLSASKSLDAKMHWLIDSMSPALHSTPVGLHATQLFKHLYDIQSHGY